MLTRRAILAAALITAPGAMAAALLSPDTCPKNGGPVPSGPISWWCVSGGCGARVKLFEKVVLT
jgi:hypothetical protein